MLLSLQSVAGLPAGQLTLTMSIRISLLVRPESSVLQQCSMLPGTCDHLFSVLLPSKKLWYLLVSIAGSSIHLNYDIQSCQVAVLLGSEIIQRVKKEDT